MNQDNLESELMKINLKKIEKEIIFKNLKKKAFKLGIEIGDEFIQMRNSISNKAYKEDHKIVRYFSNIGWFRQKFDDKCKFCGQDNSREHAVNECHRFKDDREEMKGKLKVIDSRLSQKSLTEALDEVFYRMTKKRKNHPELIEWMIETIRRLFITGNGKP